MSGFRVRGSGKSLHVFILPKLRKGQVAVALNGCSKLIGVDQVTCTMLDVKSETVDMPSANQIAIDDSDVTGND